MFADASAAPAAIKVECNHITEFNGSSPLTEMLLNGKIQFFWDNKCSVSLSSIEPNAKKNVMPKQKLVDSQVLCKMSP